MEYADRPAVLHELNDVIARMSRSGGGQVEWRRGASYRTVATVDTKSNSYLEADVSYLAALLAVITGNLLWVAAVVISLALLVGGALVVLPRRRRDGSPVPVTQEVNEMVDDMKNQIKESRDASRGNASSEVPISRRRPQ